MLNLVIFMGKKLDFDSVNVIKLIPQSTLTGLDNWNGLAHDQNPDGPPPVQQPFLRALQFHINVFSTGDTRSSPRPTESFLLQDLGWNLDQPIKLAIEQDRYIFQTCIPVVRILCSSDIKCG